MKFSRYNSISRNGAHALEIALQFPSNGMFCNFNGDGEIRTHDLSDANELKALICIGFQTFPALSAGM